MQWGNKISFSERYFAGLYFLILLQPLKKKLKVGRKCMCWGKIRPTSFLNRRQCSVRRMVITFESEDEILWKLLSSSFLRCCLLCYTSWFQLFRPWAKSSSVTIRMKATEQFFPVMLFIMLYKLILTFEPVDEILQYDHSNEFFTVWYLELLLSQ